MTYKIFYDEDDNYPDMEGNWIILRNFEEFKLFYSQQTEVPSHIYFGDCIYYDNSNIEYVVNYIIKQNRTKFKFIVGGNFSLFKPIFDKLANFMMTTE
jgi:hypothetical protein